ncbi:MAG: amidohydrolase [Clostridiales bacterium]|jgi:predicted TIM-barrel fold metal-dependent hydrolase|nr:amidohydrolase [Clostridiales bacterium]
MIVDIHTHCFPDKLASRAIPLLADTAGIMPHTDGTVKALKESMKAAGVNRSVLQPIATKPEQTPVINGWAIGVQNGSIISFGTIHPAYPLWKDEIKRLSEAGIRGIKFHPDYQNFFADSPDLFPIYEAIFEHDMIILFHAGIDIGLPPPCHCTPAMLSSLIDAFPGAPIIAAHMGGYLLWEEVKRHLAGRNIYLDTSYSFADLGSAGMTDIIKAHGADKILFGTDSPWAHQQTELANIRSLPLSRKDIDAILGGNARKLLKLDANPTAG